MPDCTNHDMFMMESSEKGIREDLDRTACSSVPEDDVATTVPSEGIGKALSEISRLDNRRSRNPPRPKRVPNLLSGTPLLPGPLTPYSGPQRSPFFSPSPYQPIAIFPNFMLAPAEQEYRCSDDFERMAMQRAIGLPPIMVDPSFLEELENCNIKTRNRRDRTKKSTGKSYSGARLPVPIFERKEEDFPSLDGRSLLAEPERKRSETSCLPAKSKMTPVKFPSKNQLKKRK
jgi:hypothetical protein